MGQGALIATVAVTITMMLFMLATQQSNVDSQEAQNEAYASEAARDLALQGRKLVLARWLETSGTLDTAPFSSITSDGGTIRISSYTQSGTTLDVTVRGEYDGAVHDVRSQYQWNSYGLNPFQVKAADIEIDISSSADLGIGSITMDDQSLSELDEVLIQDLGLGNDLSEFGLGMSSMETKLDAELSSSGNGDIQIDIVDATQRAYLEQQNGMYFPDQVEQVINSYISANPSIETSRNSSSAPSTFGLDTGNEVLRITDDFTVSGSLEGKGILIVEGSLNVPAGASLNWDGMVIVKPPSTNLNPQINFSGTVNLNGGLIALHDAMPNSGHMDITSFRDMAGSWAYVQGPDRKLWYWSWCFYHRHDFTSRYGNSIRYYANSSNDRIHEREHYLHETLQKLNGDDDIFFELMNTSAHGRGNLSMQLKNEDLVFYPVSAGFEPSMANAGNAFRTKTFKRRDLEYMHLDITRLSSLKKMWDTGSRYPGCTSTSGPLCVGWDRNRMGTLTLRLYKMNGAAEQRIYEVSMYWHRRTDEIENFEDSMEDLVTDIKSPNYGMDITMGADVTFEADQGALSMLGSLGGAPVGYVHLGTWHSHWDKLHPDNPL